MPVQASVALRLHEAGHDEDQQRLAYVLCVCLDDKERWLAHGFKRPHELSRWVLAGTERWGLAEEFEPMRKVARAEAWLALTESSHSRINEILSPRLGHLLALAHASPCIDHLYWAFVAAVLWFAAMGAIDFGSWMDATRGAWAQSLALAGCAGVGWVCLKAAAYVWQDSTHALGEGLKRMIWGPNPARHAIDEMRRVAFSDDMLVGEWAAEAGGTLDPALEKKAKAGHLSGLEALDLARSTKRAKAWREDWIALQERLSKTGAASISSSKQPGWALSRLESLALSDRGRKSGEQAQAEASKSKRL